MDAGPVVTSNAPLAPLTTLGVGGLARRLVNVYSVDALCAVLEQARTHGWPTFVLGDGSNVVVGDGGFDGMVIRYRRERLEFTPAGQTLRVVADAGVSWDRLVDEAVARNAAGIECLTGIPGRVGAAPIQNIGAYGQELSDTVVAVHAVERSSGRRVVFDPTACEFGYRMSRFKRAKDQWVVTQVELALRVGAPPTVSYAGLQERVAASRRRPTLASVRAVVRTVRAEKSMLRVPGDPNFHSAGSFFMNPVVSAAEAERVRVLAEQRGLGRPPAYPAGPEKRKLSAAWLIERAGFPKGWGDGRAGLSTRHSLALVNRGGATAADVLRSARTIRDGVRATFGVSLVPEPVFVGARWPSHGESSAGSR